MRLSAAITLGDPAGIGPEVTLAAVPRRLPPGATLVWVGDAAWLRAVARRSRLPWVWTVVRQVVTGPGAPTHQLWDVVRVPSGVVPGRVQAAAGRAAFASLERAVALAVAGRVDALVTAPVSKEAVSRSRASSRASRWTGHTEYLARCCGVSDAVMLFEAGPLRVSLVTTHRALADVPRALTPGRVARVVTRTVETLRREMGIARPRVAVAALNPHAGEGGLLGTEERRWLGSLVRRLARRLPARLSGPSPADTVFPQAVRGQFDAVVAMYHDQALIPVKLVAWDRAVNVTVGLPFVRTSPAHGTAFELAGTGGADPRSMRRALALALAMARRRRHP